MIQEVSFLGFFDGDNKVGNLAKTGEQIADVYIGSHGRFEPVRVFVVSGNQVIGSHIGAVHTLLIDDTEIRKVAVFSRGLQGPEYSLERTRLCETRQVAGTGNGLEIQDTLG